MLEVMEPHQLLVLGDALLEWSGRLCVSVEALAGAVSDFGAHVVGQPVRWVADPHPSDPVLDVKGFSVEETFSPRWVEHLRGRVRVVRETDGLIVGTVEHPAVTFFVKVYANHGLLTARGVLLRDDWMVTVEDILADLLGG